MRRDVGFTPENGRWTDIPGGPLCATTGLMHRRTQHLLFDHFVGAGEKRRRDFNTERFCGLEIDDKQEFGGLLNWKVGRFGTFQNSIHIVCAAPPNIVMNSRRLIGSPLPTSAPYHIVERETVVVHHSKFCLR